MPAEYEGGGESQTCQPYETGGGYAGAHRGKGRHPSSAGRDIGGQVAGSRYDGFRDDGRLTEREQ